MSRTQHFSICETQGMPLSVGTSSQFSESLTYFRSVAQELNAVEKSVGGTECWVLRFDFLQCCWNSAVAKLRANFVCQFLVEFSEHFKLFAKPLLGFPLPLYKQFSAVQPESNIVTNSTLIMEERKLVKFFGFFPRFRRQHWDDEKRYTHG